MNVPEAQADPARVERILDYLIAQSDRGNLNWEQGQPADSYAADIANMRIRLRSLSGDARAPFVIEIFGGTLNFSMQTEGNRPIDHKIVLLYRRGRTIALDPNRMLTNIEQQLGLAASEQDSPN